MLVEISAIRRENNHLLLHTKIMKNKTNNTLLLHTRKAGFLIVFKRAGKFPFKWEPWSR